jgi:NAD(P)H dehydrogenase (quinone)
MYAITGITGQIGGLIGRALLAAKKPVRAVVRDAEKGKAWATRGCDVALANIEDSSSLAAAFDRAEAVFVLVPPNFDPQPGFPEARVAGAALRSALEKARPARVVYLSTIGAQARKPNLLTQHTIIEQTLSNLPVATTFLRPAWFMENCRWDVAPAREHGVIPSFLQPLDKPVPMVATADIGKRAAALLQEPWNGHRVVELEGPHRVTPNEIAAAFTKILGRSVQMQSVPRNSWEELFRSQGMKNPLPRIQMLDGFNEGWIEFESGEAGAQKGSTNVEAVVKFLIQTSSE